jgi:aminoglycoside/choline kinase family phosphotransferase
VAGLLAQAGVHVPAIHAQDLAQGFLLLSDLGDTTYLDALDARSAGSLYGHALDALIRIQVASRPGALPEYDRDLLEREMRLFPDWYVARQLRRELAPAHGESLETAFSVLLANNLAQPRVFVNRDYHSRNLMVSGPCPGILDFQDAVYGPITYDLVSLLRDAYIAWEEDRVIDWTVRYWRGPNAPAGCRGLRRLYRDFEWMVQRQLKVLGIFARLRSDGKNGYLGRSAARDGPPAPRLRALPRSAPLARLLDELDATEKRVGYTF